MMVCLIGIMLQRYTKYLFLSQDMDKSFVENGGKPLLCDSEIYSTFILKTFNIE